MNRARVCAGTALPAAMDVLAPGKGGDFVFHGFVVVLDHTGFDERAPVT